MWKQGLLVVFSSLVFAACGGDESQSVTGSWCGRDVATKEECQGDEVEYLELSQVGTTVTGQICEAYGKDCAPIEGGKIEGSKVTFSFSPDVVGGTADLTLSGDELAGELHSDKCACELSFTFHRI